MLSADRRSLEMSDLGPGSKREGCVPGAILPVFGEPEDLDLRIDGWRRVMWTFILWLILLVISWPLALLALVLYPFVWLLMLPFRLIGISVSAVFHLLKAILLLPARLLGGGPAKVAA